MKSPAGLLTALASLWDRLSRWIGRTEAEQAESQQSEMDRMDLEIQATKGSDDAK